MRATLLLVAVTVLLAVQQSRGAFPPPRELFTLSWTGGPLVWPSATVRAMYRASGRFEPSHMLATRAAIFRDEVYVAFPRLRSGVAATLARAPLLSLHHEPVFEPFPSWEAQAEEDCQALQSVVDLYLDRKDVLWVLDSGVTQALEAPVRQCAPKAVAYDLVTGKQVYKIDLSSLTTENSQLQYIVADFDRQDRRFLYISDAVERTILVYNVAEETGYRVQLPEAVVGGGEQPDVLHIALAKPRSGGRRLYLGYLAGDELYSVRTEDLQTGTDHGAVEAVGHKPGKMVVIGTDKRSTIYFRYEGGSDVYSWDVSTDLTSENCHLVHRGDSALLATQAVLDPLRAKVRLLQSNVLDFLRQSVGVGAVHVLSSS